ncbi:MAG: 50S ribosomal protein L21 [Firmicutes bacterium]|nr:50S ribosomal protein L21 [Bacillota bacterium]
MYAVIETGGKQYRVQEGDVISIEKLNVEAGQKVEFDKVLVMNNDADLQIGAPYVDGAKVFGNVLENGKAKKVVIFKYKAKKDYRKKQGHRQPYTMVEITGIGADKPAKKSAPKAEAKAEAKETKKEAAPKAAAKSDVKPSLSMKKDELIAFANEHGIKVDAKATKPVILETIEAALK